MGDLSMEKGFAVPQETAAAGVGAVGSVLDCRHRFLVEALLKDLGDGASVPKFSHSLQWPCIYVGTHQASVSCAYVSNCFRYPARCVSFNQQTSNAFLARRSSSSRVKSPSC